MYSRVLGETRAPDLLTSSFLPFVFISVPYLTNFPRRLLSPSLLPPAPLRDSRSLNHRSSFRRRSPSFFFLLLFSSFARLSEQLTGSPFSWPFLSRWARSPGAEVRADKSLADNMSMPNKPQWGSSLPLPYFRRNFSLENNVHFFHVKSDHFLFIVSIIYLLH